MGEKVGHVMCEVNRGQGGVNNYGETDCKERQTRMCLCVSVEQNRCACSEIQAELQPKQAHTLNRRAI